MSTFLNLLSFVGSLGLFLYGMKIMSEGLEKLAGDKMRNVLGAMTRNRFMGVLTGVGVTALIQSSSATTVMVVSFVNAGLMTLRQAIGVIMGANIGTTVTAWIISFVGFKVSISAEPAFEGCRIAGYRYAHGRLAQSSALRAFLDNPAFRAHGYCDDHADAVVLRVYGCHADALRHGYTRFRFRTSRGAHVG